LPLLCPLAGAVAARLPGLRREADQWVRIIVSCSVIVFGVAALVLGAMAWKAAAINVRAVLMVDALLVIVATGLTVRAISGGKDWRAAWGVPVAVLLVSVVFAIRAHYDRLARTSIPQAEMIRRVAGPDAHLVTCAMVLDQPDIFYYSGLPTVAMDGDVLDWRKVPLGTWVVLEPQELKIWMAEVPKRLWNVHPFTANRNQGILLWYGEKDPPTPWL
jgi:hypothetical protein